MARIRVSKRDKRKAKKRRTTTQPTTTPPPPPPTTTSTTAPFEIEVDSNSNNNDNPPSAVVSYDSSTSKAKSTALVATANDARFPDGKKKKLVSAKERKQFFDRWKPCPHHKLKCRWCGNVCKDNHMEKHLEKCNRRLVNCEECGRQFRLDQMDTHLRRTCLVKRQKRRDRRKAENEPLLLTEK